MSLEKKIFYRIFPTEKLNFDLLKLDRKCNKIYVRHLQDLARNSMEKEASYWEFDTDGIFFNSTQEKVYTKVTEDLLLNIVKGYNGVIITFGQTGTGKTFTTSGLHLSEEDFGLAPRLAKDLLDLKKNQPSNIKMCIKMSYVEFNNTCAVDLLKDLPNSLDNYKCREARKIRVSNEYDALKCLFLGEGRKNYVENNSLYLSNVCSSVVTFHVTSKNMDLNNPVKICSRLHIVDLAGNDSCAQISKIHKNAKEIGNANVTKSQLEQFILILAKSIPENIRIKQRMNILIYYLDGDFSSDNILRFVGHIRVNPEDMLITLSMLRFGCIIQGLKPKRKEINFEMNEEIELEVVKKKLEAYEKENHLNSVLLNRDLVSGLNQSRINHLNNLVQDYLKDDIQEITVINVADTQMVLKNIKDVFNNCKNEVKRLQAENEILQTQHQSDTSLKHRGSKLSSQGSGSRVSRKSSKVKSKESILKEKRTSASTLSEKRVASDDQAVSTDISYPQKRKKSRPTVGSGLKASAQSKKKSSTTSINRQESKSSIKSTPDLHLDIPEMIPEQQEIWKHFTSHISYKDRIEEYKSNEKDVRTSFATYIKEIKKLQGCKEAVDKCSNDLIMAQTFRKFNSNDEFDENGLLIISYAEKQCKENLEQAEFTQLEQKEKVLKSQEEFKIYLENRQNIIKGIEEDFDQFAREHYKMPSSTSQELLEELKEITFNADLERSEEHPEQVQEIVVIPEISEKTKVIKRFRVLMAQEIQKRNRIINEKRNKWKDA